MISLVHDSDYAAASAAESVARLSAVTLSLQGCRVSGLGFKDEGLRIRVQGLGLRDEGSGTRV